MYERRRAFAWRRAVSCVADCRERDQRRAQSNLLSLDTVPARQARSRSEWKVVLFVFQRAREVLKVGRSLRWRRGP